ncbi:MAG: undecaprenyldiphospho-muramoylpentapeptide beta-N-acetylglucosaminyltransferase [bacterium]
MNKIKKLNVILSGGGTGGHIYPAIAVYQVLKKDSDVENIYYIGCNKNMEKDVAQKEDIPFYSVNVSGMPRKTSLRFISWFAELISATVKAFYYLLKLKPNVILGTGGYVSAPVLISATILKIPFIIHDCDAQPGIVNKALAPYAHTVSVAFEEAGTKLKVKNLMVNGNPLRESFKTTTREESLNKLNLSATKLTISIIGGSQGARSINNAALNIMQDLLETIDCQVIHQVGTKNYDQYVEELEVKYPNLKNNSSYRLAPYFDNMQNIFAVSDLIISRAGSLSLSEICLNSIPSILIPYPHAAADHQRHNAKVMENSGASVYLDDNDCTSENLLAQIKDLINNSEKLQSMKTSAKILAKENSAENLAAKLKEIAL